MKDDSNQLKQKNIQNFSNFKSLKYLDWTNYKEMESLKKKEKKNRKHEMDLTLGYLYKKVNYRLMDLFIFMDNDKQSKKLEV